MKTVQKLSFSLILDATGAEGKLEKHTAVQLHSNDSIFHRRVINRLT